MNTISSGAGFIALLACGSSLAAPISEERTSEYTYPVSSPSPRLYVRNIWGSVTVRAGAAREITVTLTERRTAPTQQSFEQSKELIRLDVAANGDGVSMVVDDSDRTNRHIDVCRGCRVEYQFEITAPPATQVDVGTVTDGIVEVTGIAGLVNATNVNGPVSVSELTNCANIESVNGALDVRFSRAPEDDCTIQTLNGRITVGLPEGTGLDAILSVNYGHIESEFDAEPVMLPTTVEKQEREGRYSYRIVQPMGVRLGGGGPRFTFASLNGDVHILKNK